jgi:hypothetical protein
MRFGYIAIIAGGIGPNVWDKEMTIFGDDMTISEALSEIEKEIEGEDATVISIEQID